MRSPCVECQYEKECSNGKACRDFVNYCNTGKFENKHKIPLEQYYRKLFGEKYKRSGKDRRGEKRRVEERRNDI